MAGIWGGGEAEPRRIGWQREMRMIMRAQTRTKRMKKTLGKDSGGEATGGNAREDISADCGEFKRERRV